MYIESLIKHNHSLSALELRQQLGEVLERVYYQFQQFRILRKDKTMARIMNERFMLALERVMQEDPALAETLEIMMDEEAMKAIEQGTKEVANGTLLPLDAILKP